MTVSLALPFLGLSIGSIQGKYILYVIPPMPVGTCGSLGWSSREERWQLIIRQKDPEDGEGNGNGQKAQNSAGKSKRRVGQGSIYVLGYIIVLALVVLFVGSVEIPWNIHAAEDWSVRKKTCEGEKRQKREKTVENISALEPFTHPTLSSASPLNQKALEPTYLLVPSDQARR